MLNLLIDFVVRIPAGSVSPQIGPAYTLSMQLWRKSGHARTFMDVEEVVFCPFSASCECNTHIQDPFNMHWNAPSSQNAPNSGNA